MNRPFIRARHVDQIAWEAVREFQIEVIAAMGDADAKWKNLVPGEYLKEGWRMPEIGSGYDWQNVDQWAFPDADKGPATADLDPDKATVEVEASEETYLWGLIRAEDAAECVREVVAKCAENAMTTLCNEALRRVRTESVGGYILTAIASRIPSISERVGWAARGKLFKYSLRQDRRRIGIQRISTRKYIPRYGWFKFSGKPAYRARVGRPALPRNVWLARYKARRAAQRKTGRTSGQCNVTVPATKHERPKAIVKLAAHHATNPDFGVTPDPVAVSLALGDWDLKGGLKRLLDSQLEEMRD